MTWYDWLILILPVCFVMAMGIRTRRYVRGVSDFLSAGRLCGRYVITMGDMASALSIIGLVTIVEINYKTGFSVGFWNSVLMPLSIFMGLTGYVTYRFRETRAMSLGQFLEMRYNRSFRVFAAALRSLAEMIANMIMPAIAARFFIRMLDLPDAFAVCGVQVSTFVALMVLFLSLAIALICCGGTLALIVADTLQGMILYPCLVCFIVFIFWKFSVSGEILPVMADRVAGESFINPFDIGKLRDFNLFSMVFVGIYITIMNRGVWIGAGYTTAAKSPQEQKMAGLLGSWRGAIVTLFEILVACTLITFLNHKNFAQQAHAVRKNLIVRAADDVLKDNPEARTAVKAAIEDIPVIVHEIGVDPPLSQESNPDTQFLETVHEALLAEARKTAAGGTPATHHSSLVTRHSSMMDSGGQPESIIEAEGRANDAFQQCRTLFNQLSLSVTMRALLPPGLFGLFTLLLFLAMLSTDDTRIYSATLTIAQDVVLPLKKKPFTPRGHLWMIRIVAICIGVFFLFGSYYMKQLDYIYMFSNLACSMWVSGAGPVMIFGLYSRFGTAAGAWAAQLASTVLSIVYIIVQRNWADVVYPALAKAGLVGSLDRLLRILSSPFEPYIHWEMDAVKCPVNTIEFTFFLSLLCVALYIVVSKLTCRELFDLDRMLHRGAAEPHSDERRVTSDEREEITRHSSPVTRHSLFRRVASRLVGITPEYSRGDKIIAWGVFVHSFVINFLLCFVGSVVWNLFHRWPTAWWGRYFVVVNFVIPGVVAAVSTVWFAIGGAIDLSRLFRDLKARKEINVLDDGRVEGHVSLADRQCKTTEDNP